MTSRHNHILDTPVEYLKGVGPRRAEVLRSEKGIRKASELLQDFPFRYIDKSVIHKIGQIRSWDEHVQLKGVLIEKRQEGNGRRKRLKALLQDKTGTIELIWFQGVKWIRDYIQVGKVYRVYGKLNLYRGKKSIAHPEMELLPDGEAMVRKGLDPVYSSTEKLNSVGMDARGQRKVVQNLVSRLHEQDLPEVLPDSLRGQLRLCSRFEAFCWIHFPPGREKMEKARYRLKFEELFFAQLRLLSRKRYRKTQIRSYGFEKIGRQFNDFFHHVLPFALTDAQKRVVREIRRDLGSGFQMNRLLQGDVGSGKTVVALMAMLIAIDNGYQSCMMAPTEILAQQHFQSLSAYMGSLPLRVELLTGSIKGKRRKEILDDLAGGRIHILVGTHALIEDPVRFQNLGLAITDEQHRFGVAQRAKLWKKADPYPPHILVMTATPIPRTLAMSFYGDLDVSVIDELPPGRKPVKTMHMRDANRPQMIKFMQRQIAAGRQIYVVYPLIEESAKLDLENLQDGYEYLLSQFPRPDYQIGVVHGRMRPDDKEHEMQRFAGGKTQILVATTVIEVGVNVPNASVMVIENAERFGLSQLHQLRGRVGRGADQSYCVLMTGYRLSREAKDRIAVMCETNDGFRIAEADLKQRGPGDIEGTRQSGDLNFRIANLAEDGQILQTARNMAIAILKDDPGLEKEVNRSLRSYMQREGKRKRAWSLIG